MKGTLTKLDKGWFVKRIEEGDWETYYPIYQKPNDFFVEDREVDFKLEKFWETGMESSITIATLYTPPYVSDDFQIGPDGAYEHTDDGSSEFHCHELLDRLTIINDMMENYLIDHPLCETHPQLKDMLTDAQDILGEVYLKIKDTTH